MSEYQRLLKNLYKEFNIPLPKEGDKKAVDRMKEKYSKGGPVRGKIIKMAERLESSSKENAKYFRKVKDIDKATKMDKIVNNSRSLINRLKSVSGGGGMMTTFKKGKILIEKMKDL